MKNLYKKVSAVALAGLVLVGGIASSGVNSFAVSSKIVSERSLIGKPILDPNKFIGYSEDFKEIYDKLMDEVSPQEIENYKKMINKIRKAVEDFPVKYYFNLRYIPLPDKVLEGLKDKKYNFESLYGSFSSPSGAVSFLYNYRSYHKKNLLVKIQDGKNKKKAYNFILYVDDKK